MSCKPITIVGGGLAGLALGIGLRQQDVPVTIFETARYPRHKVCGEFISGRGQQTLSRLGLSEQLEHLGATPAQTAAFFFNNCQLPTRRLPTPACCLSRYDLDAFLASFFRKLGGELREGERVRDTTDREGLVLATGRRSATQAKGWRWFGVKAHASGVLVEADLEMHVFRHGYIGICRLNNDLVNVCGLFRTSDSNPIPQHDRLGLLSGVPGSKLERRLRNATIDPKSIATVAGLTLGPRRASDRDDCAIGDALTMIPPATGNGMSMALEAAEIAIEPVVQYSRGAAQWHETRADIARRCDAAFASRLRWARWLQALMCSPSAQTCLRWPLSFAPVWNLAFARTR